MAQGDAGLEARLVAAGVQLVAERGAQALSLREIARAAGVSHGAPRRYFPTHLSLLSAVARTGFADLGARASAALGEGEGEPGPRDRIERLCRVYLDFARTEGGMFELMFRHDLLESGHPGLRETSLPLFGRLVDAVARVRPRPADARVAAGVLWAGLHGIAQLWCWGSLPLATGADDVEPLLRALLDAHLGPDAG